LVFIVSSKVFFPGIANLRDERSIGAPGPVIAGGLLVVGPGYVGTGNGMPGNVLLAFAADLSGVARE
jgi:hypothetical protein